jgi:hypothetical protein
VIDFDVFAVFTLLQTNGYVADPSNATVSVTISDNLGTNLFSVVGTNNPAWGVPVDIDYFAPSNCLVLSVNYGDGAPCNFALLDTNHNLTQWSGVTNLGDGFTEIKIATAKSAGNGYAAGDLFFGNLAAGGVGRVSADGTAANLNWLTLPGEPDYVAGDLCLDQTGLWGNDLMAVTGWGEDVPGSYGVWRINALAQTATQVTRIPAEHLEGVLTVPNDARYGPWAGKLLTGDEFLKLIYAVDTNGGYVAYGLDISPDTFRIIPANQDIYCCAFSNYGPSYIVKLSRQWLTPYIGDILIVQSGEVGMGAAGLYIVEWNGIGFGTRTILLGSVLGEPGYAFEKAAFAPIDIPALPQ